MHGGQIRRTRPLGDLEWSAIEHLGRLETGLQDCPGPMTTESAVPVHIEKSASAGGDLDRQATRLALGFGHTVFYILRAHRSLEGRRQLPLRTSDTYPLSRFRRPTRSYGARRTGRSATAFQCRGYQLNGDGPTQMGADRSTPPLVDNSRIGRQQLKAYLGARRRAKQG